MLVRAEEEKDREAVYAIHASAFARPAEADLVNVLREHAHPIISLVAEENRMVVGHILFSPVSLSGHPELNIMGLAPIAVQPSRQRTGVGSALVRAGLARCAELGYSAVVVLGHPTYYPRFGFAPAVRFGLRYEHDAPDEAFMALELQPAALRGKSGVVQYHAVFNIVE